MTEAVCSLKISSPIRVTVPCSSAHGEKSRRPQPLLSFGCGESLFSGGTLSCLPGMPFCGSIVSLRPLSQNELSLLKAASRLVATTGLGGGKPRGWA
jgi:hypothetical protein